MTQKLALGVCVLIAAGLLALIYCERGETQFRAGLVLFGLIVFEPVVRWLEWRTNQEYRHDRRY